MDLINALNDPAPILMSIPFLGPLIMGGLSLLGQGIGQRSASRRHAASLAANEAIDRRRSEDWREYAKQYREHQLEMLERQRGALAALGGMGLAGIPAGADLSALALGGGAAPIAPRMGGGEMIRATPQGPAVDTSGMMDAMALILNDVGQPAGPPPVLPSSSNVAGMLPVAPSLPATNPRAMMGGGNLRGWGG